MFPQPELSSRERKAKIVIEWEEATKRTVYLRYYSQHLPPGIFTAKPLPPKRTNTDPWPYTCASIGTGRKALSCMGNILAAHFVIIS